MTVIPDYYVRMRERMGGHVDWLDEAFFELNFKSSPWPGATHILEAIQNADRPISLHEAIAIAAVSEDRKYNQSRGVI